MGEWGGLGSEPQFEWCGTGAKSRGLDSFMSCVCMGSVQVSSTGGGPGGGQF